MKASTKTVFWFIFIVVLASATLTAGRVTIRFYDGENFVGIDGAAVADLTNDFTFPDGSTAEETLPQPGSEFLEWVDDIDFDNYGTYTRGFIEAPMTGDYLFYIASDDASEFWLSDGTNPVNRSSGNPTAFEPDCCTGTITDIDGLFDGERLDQRHSAPVSLVRGNKYYFEILHKEQAGGAWWRMGWQRPDGVQEQIPSKVLAPYAPGSALSITAGPESVSVSEPSPASFSVDVSGPQPIGFQWLRNGSPIQDAILSHYTIEETNLSMNGDRYSVRATDPSGTTQTSAVATLTVTVDTIPPVAEFAVTGGIWMKSPLDFPNV